MITAAAWSITGRWLFVFLPAARSCACAVTVLIRSSTTRTGTGATAAASRAANPRASCVAAP